MPLTTLPGEYIAALCRTVQGFGVDEQALFSTHRLTLAQLEKPDSRVDFPTALALFDRARLLTNEEGLGVFLGRQVGVCSHGVLGFAILTARTLQEAALLVEQYIHSRTNLFTAKVSGDRAGGWIEFQPTRVLGSLRELMMTAMLVGSSTLIDEASASPSPAVVLEFGMPEPAYVHRLAHLIPRGARWSGEKWRVWIAGADLQRPLRLSNRSANALAIAQVEADLASVSRTGTYERQVRARLMLAERIPSLEEVALSLEISSRTLKRALHTGGTSFSALVEAVRRARATTMLRETEMTVGEIANQLGYNSDSAFVRAFRRWTGMSPGQFRDAGHERV